MIRFGDIKAALDRNETERIEDAFGRLAQYPHGGGIAEATSVEDVMDLLDRVVEGLAEDRRAMPARMLAAILRVAPGTMIEGASYAEGARVVADHRKHWHAVFLMHVLPTPSDGPRVRKGRDADAPVSLTIELSRRLAKGLDAFISAQPEARLSRPEAMRAILRHTLARLGHLDGPEDASGDGAGPRPQEAKGPGPHKEP